MNQNQKVFQLQGKVQHYAWGGNSYLPALLSKANPDGKPFAEYWLGGHENAPAEIVAGADAGAENGAGIAGADSRVEAGGAGHSAGDVVPLNKYIAEAPKERLGEYVNRVFGRLPYLLKILDVKDMLSIQVHPSKKNAELEFAAENAKGKALNAPDRNYKDDNHKPELMVALSEFWLLHGFKPEAELEAVLDATAELTFLKPVFAAGGYAGLYKETMEMPQEAVNKALQPLLDRILPLYQDGSLTRGEEDFWAARAANTYNEPGRIDRGIFSIYFFNLLNLHPGDAIFQDAGMPHAYLEGQNVEIMANSDNVLRGGLTPKHVDVPELLKHVKFEATHARVIGGTEAAGHISVFKTPAPDFELSRIDLLNQESVTIKARSVEIFIVLSGRVDVGEKGSVSFGRAKGESFIAFDGAEVVLTAVEDSIIFRAAVPQQRA